MNKLILTLLMVVMVTAPCLAEVEPEGIFWVNGTHWEGTMISEEDTDSPLPDVDVAFYDGHVYVPDFMMQYGIANSSSYTDLFLLTFISLEYSVVASIYDLDGILIPLLGIGWASGTYTANYLILPAVPVSVTFTKTSDTWTPTQ